MRAQIEGYRLSAQQRQVAQHLATGLPAWAQILVTIDGPLDEARLMASFRATIDRHEVLRTSYPTLPGTGTLVQRVHDARDVPLRWRNLALPEPDADQRLDQLVAAERRTLIRPADSAAVRAVLLVFAPSRHALLLTTSPLTADRATLRLMVDEIISQYRGSLTSEVSLQYSQFAEWQQQLLLGEAAGEMPIPASDGHGPVRLPLQRPDQSRLNSAAATVICQLPDDLVRTALERAHRLRVRPESVFLGCFQVLLQRITGCARIPVGVLFPSRKYQEMAHCLGPFAHRLAVATEVPTATGFRDVAASTDRHLGEFEDVEEYLAAHTADRVPRHDIGFEFTVDSALRRAGPVMFATAWNDVRADDCPINLECVVGTESGRLAWHYTMDAIDEDYLRCLSDQYRVLLTDLVAEPETVVGAGRLPAPLPASGPVMATSSAPQRCLHELFEDQVDRTPRAIAVRDPWAVLTYRELDRQASHLAARLVQWGVHADTVVAVCLDHGATLLIALLAVLKAGGAYLPLDPAHPADRHRALLVQAGCQLALADPTGPHTAGLRDVTVIGPEAPPAAARTSRRVRRSTASELAYVLFTSGSTGLPKGVMVTHSALVNYLWWSAHAYAGAGGQGALVHGSIAFDLTVTSLFAPLLRGAEVRFDPSCGTAAGLAELLADLPELSLLKLTPSHLGVLNTTMPAGTTARVTRTLVVGGEELTGQLARPWLTGNTRVVNEYGPTEATIGCCVYEVPAGPTLDGPLPIGRPIPGAEIHLLDGDLNPVPVGVPGEIHIGGVCLARGYLAAPDLTAERFVPHPSSRVPGSRLYRTGDRGCQGPDGTIHFLGRLDDQVKVGGVRVEPAEVRHVLCGHPAVRDCVVRVATDTAGHARLVAYLVRVPGSQPVGEAALRSFLSARLPSQFVPERFRWLDTLPLTGNGKVDVRSLPAIEWNRMDERCAVAAPATTAELVVVGVFEDLLRRSPVSTDEDFFELGGHSLLAIQLIARLNAAFGCALPPAVLFEPTLGLPGSGATPARLAQLAGRHGVPGRLSCLVKLRIGVRGLPLFCVHPAGGEVLGYRDLARSERFAREVWGVQAPPGVDHASSTIESLAAQYAAEAQAKVGRACLLVGWSMGGLVAVEMARMLTGLGVDVPSVVLVDTYLPDQLPELDDATLLADFASELAELTGSRPSLASVDRCARSADDLANALIAMAAEQQAGPAAEEAAYLADRFKAYRSHTRAARSYRPRGYSGPATLVQAAESAVALGTVTAQAWQPYCPGLTDIRILPGNHLSVLRGGSAQRIAEIINAADRAGASEGAE